MKEGGRWKRGGGEAGTHGEGGREGGRAAAGGGGQAAAAGGGFAAQAPHGAAPSQVPLGAASPSIMLGYFPYPPPSLLFNHASYPPFNPQNMSGHFCPPPDPSFMPAYIPHQKNMPCYLYPPPDRSFMPAYNPHPTSNYMPNPLQKLTRITLKPKQIKDHILKLHISSPFTTNPNSLLTEKAGKPVGITYTQTGISWLLNPLIAHAVLNPEDAAKFFPPLPSDRKLANIGHTPCNFLTITVEIRRLINSGSLLIYKQDIQHLQGLSFLYFTPNLQNQVIKYLEIHHRDIYSKLLMYEFEKFTLERDVYVGNQNRNSVEIISDKSVDAPAPYAAVSEEKPLINLRNMILQKHQAMTFTCKKKSFIDVFYHQIRNGIQGCTTRAPPFIARG